jgi:hypothetical protein
MWLRVVSITGSDDEDPLGLVGAPALRQDPWKSLPPGGKYLLVLAGGNHEVLAGDSLINPESLRQSAQGEGSSRAGARRRRGGWEPQGGSPGDEPNLRDSGDTRFDLADSSAAPEARRRGRSSGRDSGPRGYDMRQIAAVEDLSTAFLDATVKDEARAQTWLAEDAAGWLRGSALLKAK